MAVNLNLTEGDDWEIPVEITQEDGPYDFTNVEFEGRYGPSHSLPANKFEIEERPAENTVVMKVPRSETRKLGTHKRLYWELIAKTFPDTENERRETLVAGVINIQRGVGR